MASIQLPRPKFTFRFKFEEGWGIPYLVLAIAHIFEAVMLLVVGIIVFGFSMDTVTMALWVLFYSAILSTIGTIPALNDEEADNEPVYLGYLFGGLVGGICGIFALLLGVYGFHVIFTPLEAAQFIAKWAVGLIIFGMLLGIVMLQKPSLPPSKT